MDQTVVGLLLSDWEAVVLVAKRLWDAGLRPTGNDCCAVEK
ncbi:hypothetical protein [Alkalibacter saccharofermentans]|nr:hypothetical protein [Alkalibacter saccharofermentans]